MAEVSIVLLILIFVMSVFIGYQVYIKDNPYEVVSVKDIRIKSEFSKVGINIKKIERKEAFYTEFGYFEDRIILDKDNYLLDGYSTYMLAKSMGIEEIEIIRDKNDGKI